MAVSEPAKTLDISRLSFSSISMFLRCPKQFWFRYVQGLKSPPAIALIEGSSHHAALEMNNRHKMQKGVDLSTGTVTGKFMEELRTRVKAEDCPYEEEGEDELFLRGKTWHQIYMNDFAPKIHPDMVEEKFEKDLKVDGAPATLSGVIDLGYKNKISDYKTTSGYGLQMKKRAIDNDLQLSLYAWAAQRRNVEMICLVKKANPEVVALASSRTQGQVTYALTLARRVMAMVRKFEGEDIYPMCSPDNFLCSEKYCGYWSRCRGAIEAGKR